MGQNNTLRKGQINTIISYISTNDVENLKLHFSYEACRKISRVKSPMYYAVRSLSPDTTKFLCERLIYLNGIGEIDNLNYSTWRGSLKSYIFLKENAKYIINNMGDTLICNSKFDLSLIESYTLMGKYFQFCKAHCKIERFFDIMKYEKMFNIKNISLVTKLYVDKNKYSQSYLNDLYLIKAEMRNLKISELI